MSDEQIQAIIAARDIDGLLSLGRDDTEEFLTGVMYGHLCNMELSDMNEVQRTLYLAMTLEDTCQADALPSLSENEEVFLSLGDMIAACETLGAVRTAGYLREFEALLPDGEVPEWDWFFDGEREDIISGLDSAISGYPDGSMQELYIGYISDRGRAEQLLDGLHS